MTIEAVLFDYSGTLFRLEEDESWLADLVDSDGNRFDVREQAEIMRRMTAPVGHPVTFDADGRYAWENRDLDPELHRKAYRQVLRRSGVAGDHQAEALYRRLIDPGEWEPYPDAGTVIELLHTQGIRTAVVSNIAFDIRPAFASRGWERYVGEFVLSYEVGAIKPDAAIFRTALDRLGVAGENALMVGDHADADGGATALGCRFALVDPLPTADRPDALLSALRDNGITA